MGRFEKMISYTFEEALLSDSPSYKMAAVAFKSGRPVASGRNSYYITHPKSGSSSCKVHAELHLTIKARTPLDGTDVCVVRVTAQKEIKHSTPCHDCARLLYRSGVKRVLYVNSDSQIVFEKLEDLVKKDLKHYANKYE
jgi:deoxycytidylate deaminase